MLASGLKDEGIGRVLNTGVRTIRRDVAELRELLWVSSRTEIVAAAIRRGWL
jgi:DNA-binding NarL/FixJ family response regulator